MARENQGNLCCRHDDDDDKDDDETLCQTKQFLVNYYLSHEVSYNNIYFLILQSPQKIVFAKSSIESN